MRDYKIKSTYKSAIFKSIIFIILICCTFLFISIFDNTGTAFADEGSADNEEIIVSSDLLQEEAGTNDAAEVCHNVGDNVVADANVNDDSANADGDNEEEAAPNDAGTDEEVVLVASGTCTDNINWTLDIMGNLELTGTGEVPDYSSASGTPWYKYLTQIYSLKVGEGITKLGAYSFYGASHLETAVLNDTVKTLGGYLFYGCSALKSLNIPEGVTKIPEYCFSGCTAIETIKLPTTVNSLGSCVFEGCSSLKDINLPEGISTIPYKCFCGCSALETIKLPSTVNRWGKLKSYSSYYSYAFACCSSLKNISIPEGITEIPRYCFSECTLLETIVLPLTLNVIDEEAFYCCLSLKKINIPEGVTEVPFYCFYGCSSLETIKLPSTINEINSRAFSGCRLKNLTIAEGTSSTSGYSTFSSLETVELPSTLTSFPSCFNSCNLKTIKFSGSISDWMNLVSTSGGEDKLSNTSNANLYIGDNKITNLVIPDGTKLIPAYSFKYFDFDQVKITDDVQYIGINSFSGSKITNLIMSTSVTVVDENAFNGSDISRIIYLGTEEEWNNIIWRSGNDNAINAYRVYDSSENDLQKISVSETQHGSVSLSESTTVIGETVTIYTKPEVGYKVKNIKVNGNTISGNSFIAVEATDYIVEVEFEKYKEVIDSGTCGNIVDWVLYEDYELDINGKGSIISTPWSDYKASIKNVNVGEGVTSIPQYCFYNCSALETIKLPTTIINFGSYAFSGCESLKSINILEGVTSIPEYCFSSCSALETIKLPTTITSFGSSAFGKCESLKSINIPEGVTSIPEYCFYNCSALETIKLPTTIINFGSYAFSKCESLKSINIPEGVTEIPLRCFAECTSLSSIYLSSTVCNVRWNAFDNTYISKVFYFGSEDEWNTITWDSGNKSIINAKRVYVSSTDNLQKVSVSETQHGSASVSEPLTVIGETVSIYTKPEVGYWQKTIKVNGTAISGNSFIAEEATDYVIEVEFEKYKEVIDSGTCGSNIDWVLYEGYELDIIGTGKLTSTPWSDYKASIKNVNVGEGVTSIPEICFYNCSALETAKLPTTITSFGSNAFSGCASLKSINIPEGVTSIPQSCFYNCSALETIELPATITSLGHSAFSGCTSLKSIYIPEGVTSIPESCFYNCSALETAKLPTTITSFGSYAFSGCTSLSSIYLSSTVCNVLWYAFDDTYISKVFYFGNEDEWNTITWDSDNESIINAKIVYVSSEDDLQKVSVSETQHGSAFVSEPLTVIGETVSIYTKPEVGYRQKSIKVNGTAISGNSFIAEEATDYVVEVEFEKYKEVIDSGTYYNIDWVLYEGYELDLNGLGYMHYNGSQDYPWIKYRGGLKSVNIGEGLKSVSQYCLYFYSSLECVKLPESLEVIEENAFAYCSKLTTITIPQNVKYIQPYCFLGCTFDSVNYDNDILSWLSINYATGWSSNIPYSLNPGYEIDNLYINGELITDLVIPDGVTEIKDFAFYGCAGLKSVTLSDDVKSIGNGAFYNCSNLSSVDLGNGVETIGDGAFYIENRGANGFETIVFPESVKTIGLVAFYGNNGLVYAEFSGKAPVVGANCFNDQTVLYYHADKLGWSSPEWNGYSTVSIDDVADYNVLDSDNKNLQGIVFTLNETSQTAAVGSGNEENNSGYIGAQKGSVVIPDYVMKGGKQYNVISIGDNAFYGNKHITDITIGKNVTSIMPSAFGGCINLSEINVSEDNDYYSSEAGVLYDKGKLYLYAYPGGKTDSSFTVMNSVKTIGQQAFSDNKYLKNLVAGNNVEVIYENAFCGLSGLEYIELPFIGTGNGNTCFSAVFDNGKYYSENVTSLSADALNGRALRVKILDGSLEADAFNGCAGIKEIELCFDTDSIPSCCFSGCESLQKITFVNVPLTIDNYSFYECKRLKSVIFKNSALAQIEGVLNIPEGVKAINESAFYGCKSLNSVKLPASLETIYSSSFGYTGVENFEVDTNNTHFSNDSSGVLYNADKTKLICYPTCRPWPYYNINDNTVEIAAGAICGCSDLVNLKIPNKVNTMDGSISDCINLTICCYRNSAAYNYAVENRLTAWYLDNKELQGISIYSLPDQFIQNEGSLNLDGLYVVGNYQGKELQIDDYTLSYDKSSNGKKTVTVEYGGQTATFEMYLCVSEQGNIIGFECDKDLDGKNVYIAVYDIGQKMIFNDNGIVSDGKVEVVVDNSVYSSADHAKLFILDGQSLAPAAEAVEKAV